MPTKNRDDKVFFFNGEPRGQSWWKRTEQTVDAVFSTWVGALLLPICALVILLPLAFFLRSEAVKTYGPDVPYVIKGGDTYFEIARLAIEVGIMTCSSNDRQEVVEQLRGYKENPRNLATLRPGQVILIPMTNPEGIQIPKGRVQAALGNPGAEAILQK